MKPHYTYSLIILFCLFGLGLRAQGLETFENVGEDATSFTNNGYTFTVPPQFDSQMLNNAGAGDSQYFLDNKDDTGLNKTYSISLTAGASYFTMKSVEVYVSSNASGNQPTDNGAVTFKGIKNGTTVFSYTKSSGFPTTLADPANGYSKINFLSLPGVGDVSSINIDKLEVSHSGAFQYISIDNFEFGAEVLEMDPPMVNSITLNGNPPTTAGSVTFTTVFSEDAINVSTDDFILDAMGTSGTISSVTGSGTTYTVTVTNISGEGTISIDLKSNTNIADVLGNSPPPPFTNGSLHTVSRCFSETFESMSAGSSTFTSNAVNFATNSTAFKVENAFQGGANDSDHMLSNLSDQGTGKKYSIKTSGGSLFTMDDMELYLSSQNDGAQPTNDGSLIVRGKKTGTILFTITKNSGFPTSRSGADNGFFVLDFATDGLNNYTLVNIDELEVEIGGSFKYIAIDNLDHCEQSVAANPPIVQSIKLVGNPLGNATIVSYEVIFDENALNVSSDDFSLTSTGTASGTIGSVSGSGNIYYVNITGVSGEGTLRLDLKQNTNIQDLAGNSSPDPFVAGEIHVVTSCQVETFEGLSNGSSSWTLAGVSFATSNTNFKVIEFPNAGAGRSDKFLDNTNDQGTGKTYSISVTNTDIINMQSMEVYLSSITNGGNNPTNDGTLTIKGKRDGVIQYTVTKSTGFLTSLGDTQGYFNWDFASEGGANNSSVDIDEIEVTLGGAFRYIAIDNFKFCKKEFDCSSSNILYVNGSASGTETGTDWSNAYTKLEDALLHAGSCSSINQIWVAAGIYTPTTTTDRSIAFVPPQGISIYGGFSGSETSLFQSDWSFNATILSGDIGAAGSYLDNSSTVVHLENSNVIIDGFIIEGGNCDHASIQKERFGAGVYMSGTATNNQINNCVIRYNYGVSGVGLANFTTSSSQKVTLTNTIIYGNTATHSGGAIGAEGGTTQLVNCTVADNFAPSGEALRAYLGNFNAVNSVFGGNNGNNVFSVIPGTGVMTYSYCAFDVALPEAPAVPNTSNNGFSIENTDPLFVNAALGNYRLDCSSSAVNAGDNQPIGVNMPFVDYEGASRVQGGTVDMGAYESNLAGDLSDTNIPSMAGLYTSSRTINDGNWKHYCDCNNNVLLSLGSNSNVPDDGVSLEIGATKATHYPANTGFVTNPEGAAIINRTWNAEPSSQPSSEVDVRYYFTQAEFNAINTAIVAEGGVALTSVEEMMIYKSTKDGAHLAIADIPEDKVIELSHGNTPSSSVWKSGSFNTDHTATFKVSSFSGGGGGGASGGSSLLPVEYLSFTAIEEAGIVTLAWSTAHEINNNHFEIEHSVDGETWVKLGQVAGNGNTNEPQSYVYIDNNPVIGLNYYRLRQVDYNGLYKYSSIVSALFDETSSQGLYPNPVSTWLHLYKEDQFVIYNSLGEVVLSGKGNRVDVSRLMSGTYTIQLSRTVKRFVKM